MYVIDYKNEEDIFKFETPAKHPFEAIKIWQESIKCFGECAMISLTKENYKVVLF